MSSFEVNKETTDRIVTALVKCAYGQSNLYFTENEITAALEELGFDLRDDVSSWDALGCALITMNREALAARYNDTVEPVEYKHTNRSASNIQVLKSVGCYLYQCSEGDVPEKKLFRILKVYEEALQSKIVSELPEYEAAVWG